MRPDEAAFYLAKVSIPNRESDKYGTALYTLLNMNTNDSECTGPYVILYLDTNTESHLTIGFHAALYKHKTNYKPIKYFRYKDVFYECFNPTYEHHNPEKNKRSGTYYDKPMEYFDFDTLIEDVLKKEAVAYYLNPDDYFLIPAFETDAGYVWQVFIIEPDNERYVGRITFPKN